MDPLTLYFIFQADAISKLFVGLAFISVIGTGVISIVQLFLMQEEEDLTDSWCKVRKYLIIAFFPLVILATLTPSTRTLVAIFSVDALATAASDNEELGRLPDNVLEYINTYLEKEVENMQEPSQE